MVPVRHPGAAPTLKRERFVLQDEEFKTVFGHDRVEGSRLLELFYPQRLPHQEDQDSARKEAKDLFCKEFFCSQMLWYGIRFKERARAPNLEQRLRTAVEDGKCAHTDKNVLQLELNMRSSKTYANKLLVWKRKVEEWTWSRTPAEDKATQDIDRFISFYFLDSKGEPDRKKQPEPMFLCNHKNRCQLYEKVKHVPGLVALSVGEGERKALCIGWDLEVVQDEAQNIDNESRDELEAEKRDNWDKILNDHIEFVDLVETRGPEVDPESMQPVDLQKCKGSYTIRCEAVEKEWPSQRFFTLDIADGDDPLRTGSSIAMGWLEMSTLEGTMLLSLDQESLDAYTQGTSAGEDEADKNDEEEVAEDNTVPGNKRKAASANNLRMRPSKKARIDEPAPVLPAPVLRIYLRLRGQESEEGNILSDPKKGHIDFLDDTYTSFNGVVDLPYVNVEVTFEGFKTSDAAKKCPKPWETSSDKKDAE
ncbi:hypothetical protein PG988_011806 [Apiospora saccharicola]